MGSGKQAIQRNGTDPLLSFGELALCLAGGLMISHSACRGGPRLGELPRGSCHATLGVHRVGMWSLKTCDKVSWRFEPIGRLKKSG